MVVSHNKGTPIQTPKHNNPYPGDPQVGTLHLRNPVKGDQAHLRGPMLKMNQARIKAKVFVKSLSLAPLG